MGSFWAFARDNKPYTEAQFKEFYGPAGDMMWQDAVRRLPARLPSQLPPGSSVGAMKCIPLISWEALFDLQVRRLEALDAVGTDIGWATYFALRFSRRRTRSEPLARKVPLGDKLVNRRLIQERNRVRVGVIDLNALH